MSECVDRTRPGSRAGSGSLDVELGFLHDDLGFHVIQARRAIGMAVRNSAPASVRSSPGGMLTTLVLIGLNPAISQSEIAKTLFLDASKVALLIRELQRAGLVRKTTAAGDARRVELYLTGEGEQKFAQMEANRSERENRIASGLNASERRQLVALLLKLQDALR